MPEKFFVYNHDNLEPGVQRTALERGSSAPAPWRASEHSTFDVPSRAIENVKARRVRGPSNLVITMVLVAVSAVAAGAVAVLR
jgi:hypothetical protein